MSTGKKPLLSVTFCGVKQNLQRRLFLTGFLGLVAGDNHVFPFLLAVEKMMNNGSVSCDEWQLFTRMSSNAEVDRAQDSDVQKPRWVSHQVTMASEGCYFVLESKL